MPNENVTPDDATEAASEKLDDLKDSAQYAFYDLKDSAQDAFDDLKDSAEYVFDDLKDSAQDAFNDVKARLTNLSLNQKLVLTGGLALISSVVISKIVEKVRAVRVDEMNVVVVEGDVLD